MRNTYTGNWQTRFAFLRIFSRLSSHFYRESIGAYPCRIRENLRYTTDTPRIRYGKWANKVRRKFGEDVSHLGKAQPAPRSSLPSLLLPLSLPLPSVPIHISPYILR